MMKVLLFILATIEIISMTTCVARSEEVVEEITHFRSRLSDVYIVPNFLPLELAETWRDSLRDTWNNTLHTLKRNDDAQICVDENCGQDESSIFVFATNNRGKMQYSNNAKYRSLEMIDERKVIANAMYDANQFSYAKWELHPSNPLVAEMENFMASEYTRKRIQNIIRERQSSVKFSSDLSDFFVTLFSTGDFLSPHDDGNSGTFAFVLSLMEGEGDWLSEYGGELRFQCEETIQRGFSGWCETLKPSFNSLILIETRVQGESGMNIRGPLHEVISVNKAAQDDGFYRYGFTGWYNDESDIMSESERMERDKMRAR